MAEGERVQFARRATAPVVVAAGCFLALAMRPLAGPAGADVGHPAIRDSARWPVFAWCLAWPLALARPPTDPRPLRAVWALGCALLLAHIAVAFHLGHGWSHAAAWEHTRATGGYGDGVFVNYLFALVWLADAAWAYVAFDSYLRRPRWLKWAVFGFLAFIVFNAAVVFGGPRSRVVTVLAFCAGLVVASRFRRAAEGERGA